MSIKELLESNRTEYIMEVHDSLSARIIENAGFKGAWCSSFSLSATKGLRDINEMTMTDVLNVVDEITSATKIPVLLDADNGYGDFNNSMLLVKKAEKIKTSGICIEDKKFPKVNSLIDNRQQQMLSISEFCKKIDAMCNAREISDLSIVARTEGFIYDESAQEVVNRAQEYVNAGADAIFIHSRKKDITDIQEFFKLWKCDKPVVICPTTYCDTEPEVYSKLGVSMVIWGNHMLRAAVNNMQYVAKRIYEDKKIISLDNNLTSVNNIFQLQHMDEYYENLKKFG